MRILLLSDMFPPDADGGQEVNAEKIAKGLRGRGHELEVVTAVHRPSYSGPPEDRPWVHRLFEHGPQHYPATSPVDRLVVVSRYIKENRIHQANLQKLRDFLRDRSYDVVYCFGVSRVGYIPTLAATEKHIPILWHQGGNNIENRLTQIKSMGALPKTIRSRLKEEERLDLRHIAYVSQFLIDDSRARGVVGVNGRGSGTTVVIPRGIEYEVRKDVDRPRATPPAFLMAGRIAWFKGFHHAIEAAGELFKRAPELEWRLEIVGAPDDADFEGGTPGSEYMAGLQASAKEYGIADRVHFLGKRSRMELQDLMASATAFISASICGEAFANTIIETLANGTALIASADGSALEVVSHEKSALVFEPGNSRELSGHMERILREPELVQKLATAGPQIIEERYLIDRVLDLTESVLQRVSQS